MDYCDPSFFTISISMWPNRIGELTSIQWFWTCSICLAVANGKLRKVI